MSSDNKNRRLQELGGSDFKIVDGEPNIKGWDVKDENGKKIGEVDELIFDTQSRKVRYIVVDLEDNVFDVDAKEVLVPIGLAQLHEKDDDVILPGVTTDQLQALPDYDEDALDSGVETTIRNVFGGVGAASVAGGALVPDSVKDRDTYETPTDTDRTLTTPDDVRNRHTSDDSDFYSHEHFKDDKFYGNRKRSAEDETTIPIIKEEIQIGKEEVESGGIRLRQRIVDNDVEKNINLREENVGVERTAVDRPASEADIREQEIEMRETKEVPVVNKTARVVEEVSLNKDVNEREETIRDTIKSTEVDIEKLDKEDKNRQI